MRRMIHRLLEDSVGELWGGRAFSFRGFNFFLILREDESGGRFVFTRDCMWRSEVDVYAVLYFCVLCRNDNCSTLYSREREILNSRYTPEWCIPFPLSSFHCENPIPNGANVVFCL